MAKKTKEYISLVNERVGSDESGNARIVFEAEKAVKGLTPSQVKYYKQIKYIK